MQTMYFLSFTELPVHFRDQVVIPFEIPQPTDVDRLILFERNKFHDMFISSVTAERGIVENEIIYEWFVHRCSK